MAQGEQLARRGRAGWNLGAPDGITEKQHDFVLGWTSLWILGPMIMRECLSHATDARVVPRWFSATMVLATVASILHWQNNKPYDARHYLDLALSGLTVGAHFFHLWALERLLHGLLFAALIAAFLRQSRLAKKHRFENPGLVHWPRAMGYHLLFRYFAFWLLVCAHSFGSWLTQGLSLAGWVVFVAGVSFLYALSVYVLLELYVVFRR
jgi:hypothetical protein